MHDPNTRLVGAPLLDAECHPVPQYPAYLPDGRPAIDTWAPRVEVEGVDLAVEVDSPEWERRVRASRAAAVQVDEDLELDGIAP